MGRVPSEGRLSNGPPIFKVMTIIQTSWTPPAQSIQSAPCSIEWANERLLEIGGSNPFGKPQFRLVWSNERMELVGGEFDKYLEGTDIWIGLQVIDPTPMPKYWTHPDRFIVECWRPAEVYAISEEQWYRLTSELHEGRWIPVLGPYPAQGDYEPAWILEDENGNFLQPTHTVMDEIVGRIRASRERFTSSQRKAALDEREAQRVKDFESLAESIVKDSASGFPGNSEVVLTDNNEGVQNGSDANNPKRSN